MEARGSSQQPVHCLFRKGVAMYVLLMRHGHAEEISGPEGRALSQRGRAEVSRSAELLVQAYGPRLAVIYHSRKLRAAQTAGILAGTFHHPPIVQEADDLLPLDRVAVWADRLQKAAEPLALVGHMPFMAELTMHFLRQGEDFRTIRFQTGQIICLEREEDDLWRYRWTVVPE